MQAIFVRSSKIWHIFGNFGVKFPQQISLFVHPLWRRPGARVLDGILIDAENIRIIALGILDESVSKMRGLGGRNYWSGAPENVEHAIYKNSNEIDVIYVSKLGHSWKIRPVLVSPSLPHPMNGSYAAFTHCMARELIGFLPPPTLLLRNTACPTANGRPTAVWAARTRQQVD